MEIRLDERLEGEESETKGRGGGGGAETAVASTVLSPPTEAFEEGDDKDAADKG